MGTQFNARSARRLPRLAILFLLLTVAAGCSSTVTDLRQERATRESRRLRDVPPPPEPLTRQAAVAYALEHNLDQALLALEHEVQTEAATGARLRMLPNLNATSAWSRRDTYRASGSLSLETRRPSLEPSFSSEKTTRTAELRLAWSLLDFGIAYVRSRQAHKQVLLIEQRLRRLRQTLALEVTNAYLRALVAEEVLARAEGLLEEAVRRQEILRRQVRERQLSELVGLEGEETLVLVRMQAQQYQRERESALAELRRLMGLPPGMPLTLDPSAIPPPATEATPPDLDDLEDLALRQRPELHIKDLEESIAREEVKAAWLSLLPSPTAFVTRSTDRNKFLVHNTWWEAGLQAAWDLLAIPSRAAEARARTTQVSLIEHQRLAMAVAVLMQVHLAAVDLEQASEQARLAEELRELRERRLEVVRRQVEQGQAQPSDLLEIEARSLFAWADAITARAETLIAQTRLEVSVGETPLAPAVVPAEILATTVDAPVAPSLTTAEGADEQTPASRTQATGQRDASEDLDRELPDPESLPGVIRPR